MLALACAVLLVAGVAGKATSHSAGDKRIEPELNPKSDKVFYKHDYPEDLRPTHDNNVFDHPFPLVQDSEDFDKDYVKDENFDKGSWKLQQKFDKLAEKLAQARAVAGKAKSKEDRKYRDLTSHRVQERDARLEAREARAAKLRAEKRAAERLEDAEANLDHVMGKDVTSEGIAEATRKLKNETKDLEDCKQELAKEREKLKKMQQERIRREDAAQSSGADRQKAEEAELAREKEEAELEGAVSADEQKYESAHRTHDQQVAALAKMEADLKKAEEKVRHFRRQEDASGGVFYAKPARSSAQDRAHTGALLTAIVAAFVASTAQLL